MRVKMFIRFNSTVVKIAWARKVEFYLIVCQYEARGQ